MIQKEFSVFVFVSGRSNDYEALVLVYQIGVSADISLTPLSINTTIIQEPHGQGILKLHR